MDSSETKTGTVMREDTAENSGVSSHYVIDIQGNGWLTFESGNVTNGSGAESGRRARPWCAWAMTASPSTPA